MKRQRREVLLGHKTGRLAALALAVIMVVGIWTPIFGAPAAYETYAQEELVTEETAGEFGDVVAEVPADVLQDLETESSDVGTEDSTDINADDGTDDATLVQEYESSAASVAPLSSEIAPMAVTHAINITTVENGAITTNVSEASEGDTVTLTIIPGDNCGLVPDTLKVNTDSQNAKRVVRGAGTPEDPYTFVMPNDSVTITAEFIQYRKITIEDGIENGTITTNVSQAVKHEVVTITVTPDPGYRLKFDSIINEARKTLTFVGDPVYYEQGLPGINYYLPAAIPDNGAAIGDTSLNCNIEATEYYFYMPNYDMTITAEFAESFAINIDENIVGGTIDLQGRTHASVGESFNPQGVADAGYKFVDQSIKIIDDSTGKDVVGIDRNGDEQEYKYWLGFIMPKSSVTMTAEFVEVPPLPPLEGILTAEASDARVSLKWETDVYYDGRFLCREKDSTYISYSSWARVQAGNSTTHTFTGLKNGVEYEFWTLDVNNLVSDSIFVTPVAAEAEQVIFNTNTAISIPGGEVVLHAEFMPSVYSSGLTWTSSDEEVATVEQNGRIKALSVGKATITATSKIGDASDSCVLTVQEADGQILRGSMVIGTADATYDETGGRVDLPFTVTVPSDKPNYRAYFGFNTPASAVYRINGISLDGVKLTANSTTKVGDINVQIGALPHPSSIYNAWGTITPAEGKFLPIGKSYVFTLDIEILPTALPLISVALTGMGNYRTFHYYDPDNDNRTWIELTQAGSIRATWTGAGEEPPKSGTGNNVVYNISTADEFMWFANKWNTDDDFNFNITLYRDIDLTGKDFKGIGTKTHPFGKNFNGSNYTVKYNMTEAGNDVAVGLIRYMNAGQVSNLKVDGKIDVSGNNAHVGGIVGEMTGNAYLNGRFENKIDIDVTGTGGSVGGFIGEMKLTVSRGDYGSPAFGSVINNGKVNAPNSAYVGGIAGYVETLHDLADWNGTRMTNNAAIIGSGCVGGFVGYMESIGNPKRIGTTTNYGSVTSTGGEATGGIVGKMVNSHLGEGYEAGRGDGNYNYGAVSGSSKYVGGIVGMVDNTASQLLIMSYNEGSVNSTYTGEGGAVGGVIAYLTGSQNILIKGNITKGTISGGANVVKGGVIAKVANTIDLSRCRENYYAEQDGLGDAINSIVAPSNFLSLNGWAPNYSGSPEDDGSIEKPYKLANAFDMLWFAAEVNGGSESDNRAIRRAYAELTADIDLTEYPAFVGIGVYGIGQPTFRGNFDGKDHTITIALDASDPSAKSRHAAIFQQCGDATVKNLIIRGSAKSKVNEGEAAGLAINFTGGAIENVTNYADITGFDNAAGITTGALWGGPDRLINVKNYGRIIGTKNAAGIVSMLRGQCVIDRCENHGDVSSGGITAGLIGLIDGGSKSNSGVPSYYISNCINTGFILSMSSVIKDSYDNQLDSSLRHSAGGIIGVVRAAIVDIRYCVNDGDVQSAGNCAGGIVGGSMDEWNIGAGETSQMTDLRIYYCTNNGNISSIYNGDDPRNIELISVGGIIGATVGYEWFSGLPAGTQGLTVIGNTNNGIIKGPVGSNVGSIIGITDTSRNSSGGVVTIDNNYSSTDIVGGGKDWGNPNYYVPGTQQYDPDTHYIVDGKLVERNPYVPPVSPPEDNTKPDDNNSGNNDPIRTPEPDTNNNQNNVSTPSPSGNNDRNTTPQRVVVLTEGTTNNSTTTPPVATITPPSVPRAPAPEQATDPSEVAPDESIVNTEAERAPATFYEVMTETFQNNPWIVALIIAAVALLVALGGVRRYRRSRG